MMDALTIGKLGSVIIEQSGGWIWGKGSDTLSDKLKNIRDKKQVEHFIEEVLNSEELVHEEGLLENDFDFLALKNYIIKNIWKKFKFVHISNSNKECHQKFIEIFEEATNCCNAKTEESKRNVYRIVSEIVVILENYYQNQIDDNNKFLINKASQEVINHTDNISKHIEDTLNSSMSGVLAYLNQNNTSYDASYKKNDFWKTDYFANKWTEPIFLEDELSLDVLYNGIDGFYMPAYTEYERTKSSGFKNNLKIRLRNISLIRKGLLLIGPPGIGKSTIVSWFCNCNEYKDRIFAYSIAQIYEENIHIDKAGLSDILDRVGLLSYTDRNKLPKESILILDGLDEIFGKVDNFDQYIKNIIQACRNKELIPILTCRSNYINDVSKLARDINCLSLEPWDSKTIRRFIELYSLKTSRIIDDTMKSVMVRNKELYGIPLLSYIVLTLEISIGEDEDVSELYDRIFDKNGQGIFGRYVKCNDGSPIDYEHSIDINSKLVSDTLAKSRQIAFEMFENGVEEVINPFTANEKVLKEYFRKIKITEGNYKIQFVHRSMYEYFAAEYIITKLTTYCQNEVEQNGEDQKAIKDATSIKRNLAWCLKRGKIDQNSIFYKILCIKLNKLFAKCGYVDAHNHLKKSIYELWEHSILEMFNEGMLRNAYNNTNFKQCSNNVEEELNCSYNIFIIWDILFNLSTQQEKQFKRLGESANSIIHYLQINSIDGKCLNNFDFKELNLSGINLTRAELTNSDLTMANLTMANLTGANLNRAILTGANLSGANLNEAYLGESQLSSANLSRAYIGKAYLGSVNLSGANLSRVDLGKAYLRFANLSEADLSKANLSETDFKFANMKNSNLTMSNIVEADLSEADLSGANLCKAELRKTNCNKSVLREANLSKADLREVNLNGADLTKADLTEVDWVKVDLQNSNLWRANLSESRLEKVKLSKSAAQNVRLTNKQLESVIWV